MFFLSIVFPIVSIKQLFSSNNLKIYTMKNGLLSLIFLSVFAFELTAQVTLFDPIQAPSGGMAAQDFEPANNSVDCFIADDFLIPPGEHWKIDSIIFYGFYSTTPTPAIPEAGIVVKIYENIAGAFGALVFSDSIATDVDFNADGWLTPDWSDDPILLGSGSYWIVAAARKDFNSGGNTGGQWYWTRDSNLTGEPAMWSNPGNGFASGCTSFVPLYSCALLNTSDSGMAFRMFGCINPPLDVTLSQGDTTLCEGEAIISITASSTSPGVDYLWNTGSTSNTVIADSAGIYTVTVTNPVTGCGMPQSAHINLLPVPNYDVADVTTCSSALPYTFIANSPGMSVVWPSGNTSVVETIGVAGTYVVTLTGNNGCVGTDTFTLTVQDLEPITSPVGPVDLCIGESFMAGVFGTFNEYEWFEDGTSVSISDSLLIISGGVFTVNVTNPDGCTGTAELTVIERPVPTPVIQSQYTLNFDVQLFINGSFTSYEWSNGSTSNSITVTQNGTYTVTVVDAFGCEGSGSTSVNSVGIEDPIANQVTVYPNPAKDHVSFTFPNTWIDNASVEVFDTQGRQVSSFSVNSNTHTMTLDQMSPGVYLIQFTSPEGTGNTSLILTE